MGQHDNAYRDFFSHREMVADLIRDFIPLPWAREVDLDTLERVNASYVDRARLDRESDVVWRFRLAGEWAYVYLLLEFQSTVDATMALRMVLYRTLLALDLVKAKQVAPGGPFPHIFPVVLYNGDRPWTAATEVAELFPAPLPGSEPYALRGRYLVIEERAFADTPLPTTRNLVGALFALESSRSVDDILRVVRALIAALTDPAQESLRQAFGTWIRQVMLPARFPEQRLGANMGLGEVEIMLAERVQRWYQEMEEKGLQQGLEKGLEQGLQQGLQQGQARGRQLGLVRAALRLLEDRFGPPDPATLDRLGAIPEDALLDLIVRIPSAPTLDAVFAG